MGRLIILSLISLVFAASCQAQFEQGRSELGLVGSMGSYSNKSTVNGPYTSSYSDSRMYLSFAAVYDYYIVQGFSLEPEVAVTWLEKSEPAAYLLGNISYTHRLTESPAALYGRIGYGVSNGVESPMFVGGVSKVLDKLKVGVFNAGIGTKILLGESTLIRLELNYRTHAWTENHYNYNYESTLTNVGILSGISFLF